MSFRPYQSFFRKIGQFLVRLCVAALMGVTIAHPLVLLLFRDTISTVIEKNRQVEAAQIRDGFTNEKNVALAKIADVEKSIADLRQRWNDTFKASFIVQANVEKAPIAGLTADQQAELKAATDDATAPFRTRLEADQKQAADLTPGFTKLQADLAFLAVGIRARAERPAQWDCGDSGRARGRSRMTRFRGARRRSRASAGCSIISRPSRPRYNRRCVRRKRAPFRLTRPSLPISR